MLEAQNHFVTELAATLGAKANVNSAFGEAVTRGEITVIPVARCGVGVGGGQAAQGFGGGGGGGVQPVGFIEIHGDKVTYRPISSPYKWLGAVIAGALLGAWLARR